MSASKRDARRARKHADAVRALERAEKRLHRAFTAWSNARATVRRYDAEADRELVAKNGAADSPPPFNDAVPV